MCGDVTWWSNYSLYFNGCDLSRSPVLFCTVCSNSLLNLPTSTVTSLPLRCLAGFLPVRLNFRSNGTWLGWLLIFCNLYGRRRRRICRPSCGRITVELFRVHAQSRTRTVCAEVCRYEYFGVNYHASDPLRLVMSDVFCRCFQLRGALSDI